MKRYRIEIVRRGFGRFGWNFVRVDDRGRRVFARSERSYRSRKRVLRAIAALGEARVVDVTKNDLPFPLPATSFRFVRGVVPLIVDESPVEEADAVFRVSAGPNNDREAAAAAEKEEDAVDAAQEPEAIAAAATPKPPAARARAARRRSAAAATPKPPAARARAARRRPGGRKAT
jgi:hypothetical protein